MMKTIEGNVNWGIIGCGDVCEIKSGPAFKRVPHSTLAAVMRRNLEKAKDFAQRHQVPTYYDHAVDLIKDPRVNAIYIATPPAYHETYALQAMKAGKPVYIEKPVALNVHSCKKMAQYASETEMPASVAHYRRQLPLFMEVKKLLSENILGNLKLIDLVLQQSPNKNTIAKTEENWRIVPDISGGGLFHDLAPHQLDIMYWLFGKPSGVHGKSLNQDRLYDSPDMVSVDAFYMDQIYMRGIWAFNLSENSVEDCCTIYGEKGKLSFPFFSTPELKLEIDSQKETIRFENPPHIQQPFIEQVVQFFRGKTPNPCSLDEALVSMEMLDVTVGK
jgi:predicted dehydrogenase